MPFMKNKMKKKDEVELEEMQQQINENLNDEVAADAAMKDSAAPIEEGQELSYEALLAAQEKLAADIAERDSRYLRLQADFENFRRRTRQEKEELAAVVTQELLKDMLPLVDNFERALLADKDAEGFYKGVEMIYNQMGEILQKNGLTYIETAGKKFDPNFHQAVLRVQDEGLEDDTITLEMQKGYMVKGRVIRPSMVQVVGN